MTSPRVCLGIFTVAVVLSTCDAQDHPMTVKDDIEMTRFSDPSPVAGVDDSDLVRRSPDGKWFVLVTTRGVLKTDRTQSTIWIIDAAQAVAALESVTTVPILPREIATLVSFTHHNEPVAYAAVITDVRWASDSKSVYYRGESLSGNYRLCQADVGGGRARFLTPPEYSVTQYDAVGQVIVYMAEDGAGGHIKSGNFINADALSVTGFPLTDILFARDMKRRAPNTSRLYVVKRSNGVYTTSVVPNSSVNEVSWYPKEIFPFSVAPGGNRLIELTAVATVPRSWEKYEPATGFQHLRFRSDDPRLTSNTNLSRPREYTLIDLKSGKRLPLVKAPNGVQLAYIEENRVVWSRDEKRVLVTNTFLPLDNAANETHAERLRPCAVASVDMQNLETHCIVFADKDSRGLVQVENLSFGMDNDEVLLRLKPVLQMDRAPYESVSQKYRDRGGEWEPVGTSNGNELTPSGKAQPADAVRDVELVVGQTLNAPPTLWVRSKKTGQRKVLWNPNPQFSHIQFGDASVYRWKDRSGYQWTGGLVKPVGYVPGRRYPLVLQMYMFYDGEFMTDGTFPTAFAARELASVGFVVLQIQKKMMHSFDDAEAQEHLEGYLSAIDHLDKDGLIDTRKVGIVGFSWTSWYVENALIKAPHSFAAATIADGVDDSYMSYHLYEHNLTIQEQYDRIIGSRPFGDGLKRWLEFAPGFHLDRIETPLRIEAINPESLLQEWEIYSSLRLQGKPVDLIYFPSGTHIHQRPLERLESQQGNVDWLRFWLQGDEDPDLAKQDQYRRWRQMRGDINRAVAAQ